jgi:hypothetical protein
MVSYGGSARYGGVYGYVTGTYGCLLTLFVTLALFVAFALTGHLTSRLQMGVRVATHVALHTKHAIASLKGTFECCGVWRASAVRRWTCSLSLAILRKERGFHCWMTRTTLAVVHCLADRAVQCAHRRVIFHLDMHVGSRRESVLVWDEEDDFNVNEESKRLPHERWDE